MIKWTKYKDYAFKMVRKLEEEMKEEEMKEEDEEITAEKLLDSILLKGLFIVDKVLGKVNEKLDDPEFMKKVEESINRPKTPWSDMTEYKKAKLLREKKKLDEEV